MDIIKIIGIGFIALIIAIILKQYRPEFAIYVSIVAGVLILLFLADKITEIFNLIESMSTKSNINSKYIMILIKITGIAILTEFAVSVCKDANETSIASKIDMGGKVLIIGISLPIIKALLETAIKILPWIILYERGVQWLKK